jgi:hypothetical protein
MSPGVGCLPGAVPALRLLAACGAGRQVWVRSRARPAVRHWVLCRREARKEKSHRVGGFRGGYAIRVAGLFIL